MTIVILAIGERLRLVIVDGNALFWFGAFSLPHVFSLFFIVWAGRLLPREAIARPAPY
jgi:hypothetical protein